MSASEHQDDPLLVIEDRDDTSTMSPWDQESVQSSESAALETLLAETFAQSLVEQAQARAVRNAALSP